MGLQLPGGTDLVHLVPQGLLDEGEGVLGLLVRLLGLGHVLQAQIPVHSGAELLVLVLPQDLHQELVRLVGEVEDLDVPLPEQLRLGQVVHGRRVLPGGVVDVLLVLLHPVHVLAQGDHLLLRGGVEQQKVLEQLPLGAVVVQAPYLQLAAEVLEELLIALPVLLQQPLQLGLDLLLDVVGDELQLPVVLEQLPGDVQAQVRGVHNAPDEAEVLPDEVRALVHDEHAGGVELEPPLIVGGVVVEGRPGGDEEQGLVADLALGGDGDDGLGRGEVHELLLVELLILLLRHVALPALPDGHHAVEGLLLLVRLILRLVLGAVRLLPGLGDLHADGPADVVGVLLHQIAEGVLLEELAVIDLLPVGLDVHDDVGAHGLLLAGGDGVAVGPVALPAEGLVAAVLPGNHGDLVGDHEGGVEAHAELADDVHVRRLRLFHLLAELESAAGGDDSQVVLQVALVHADAVVADGEDPGLRVRLDVDEEVLPLHPHILVGEGLIAQLVDGVAGVGDDLTEKDLLVGVNGVDHQVQQPLGLRLEFSLCHCFCFLL